MALVYMATNIINGKRYIGVSRRTIEYRRYHHFFHAKKGGSTIFARAIRKYGESAFKFEIIDTPDTYDEALTIEIEKIEELKPEYNMAGGGRGAKNVTWNPERRIKALAGMRASWTEQRRKTASERWKGKPPSIITLEAAWAATRQSSRSIICLDTGVRFGSATEAADRLNIPLKGIRNVLCGAQVRTRNLRFQYIEINT